MFATHTEWQRTLNIECDMNHHTIWQPTANSFSCKYFIQPNEGIVKSYKNIEGKYAVYSNKKCHLKLTISWDISKALRMNGFCSHNECDASILHCTKHSWIWTMYIKNI